MKLGLMGTTILYSSGDNGVGSSCTTFQIDAQPACPYVIAVGGTMIPSSGSVTSTEVAWNIGGGTSSSGGFSNVWPMPSY